MAEDKKGFLLYADYEELFDELPDEIAGKLIKHIIKYVNDKNPISDNAFVKVAFIPIKRQLKRDLEKYEVKREQWSDAGKKSAEVRKLKREQALNDVLTESTNVKSVATESTVNVNGNVSVNVNDINNKANALEFDLFWNLYNKKVDKVKCLKVWNKINSKEIPLILDRAKIYIETTQEIRFRKNPLTWLNGKCWQDEIENTTFVENKSVDRPIGTTKSMFL